MSWTIIYYTSLTQWPWCMSFHDIIRSPGGGDGPGIKLQTAVQMNVSYTLLSVKGILPGT